MGLFRDEKLVLAERGFDPRTSGLWAQHASTAPLCYTPKEEVEEQISQNLMQWPSHARDSNPGHDDCEN